jgi:hypothetical protein
MTISAGAINRDHVHLLVGIPPNMSVSPQPGRQDYSFESLGPRLPIITVTRLFIAVTFPENGPQSRSDNNERPLGHTATGLPQSRVTEMQAIDSAGPPSDTMIHPVTSKKSPHSRAFSIQTSFRSDGTSV